MYNIPTSFVSSLEIDKKKQQLKLNPIKQIYKNIIIV